MSKLPREPSKHPWLPSLMTVGIVALGIGLVAALVIYILGM